MSKALEAAARELVKYNTIPELYEQEWPKCANPAGAAILAFLRAEWMKWPFPGPDGKPRP